MRKKKRIDDFLSFFESRETDEKNENEKIAVLERIMRFLRNFRGQTLQYKIVWTVRIALWAILVCVAVFGLAIQIKSNIR